MTRLPILRCRRSVCGSACGDPTRRPCRGQSAPLGVPLRGSACGVEWTRALNARQPALDSHTRRKGAGYGLAGGQSEASLVAHLVEVLIVLTPADLLPLDRRRERLTPSVANPARP